MTFFEPPVSEMCRSTMLLIFPLLTAYISSLSGQEARFGIGTSLGCIILFLVASVPGLPHDKLFKRVSTISSREVGSLTSSDNKNYQQHIRWALGVWFGHLQSSTVPDNVSTLQLSSMRPLATPLPMKIPLLGEQWHYTWQYWGRWINFQLEILGDPLSM